MDSTDIVADAMYNEEAIISTPKDKAIFELIKAWLSGRLSNS